MTGFRNVEFVACSPAPTKRQLRALESAVGAALPAEFKRFLRDANGAEIPYALYVDTEELAASLNFRWIFSTYGDDSFLDQLTAVRARWTIPLQILPFACEEGDSFVCLDLRPHRYGAVVALLTEDKEGQYNLTGWLADPPFVQVAPSFLEYIDRLVPEFSEAAFGIDEDEASET